ncbi:MAG: signal peptidase I [Myxococcota bacterium]|nr:signal peptidase I [Myxococcota bacterium]
MSRLRILLALVGATALVMAAAVLVPLRTVAGDDMSWSLRDGDRIWIIPDRIRRSDVVLVTDPLDPSRQVLRRAIAHGGQRVRVEDGTVRVDGKRIRQQEMGDPPQEGDGPELTVLKEVIWSKPPARANRFFPTISDRATRWSAPGVVEVPAGHWYVLADNRDAALDSRWWGPLPESAIHGVVRARYGEGDIWRETAFELLLPEE